MGDTLPGISQLLVPGNRFWAMIADDVTPLGPSDVTGSVVVVVAMVCRRRTSRNGRRRGRGACRRSNGWRRGKGYNHTRHGGPSARAQQSSNGPHSAPTTVRPECECSESRARRMQPAHSCVSRTSPGSAAHLLGRSAALENSEFEDSHFETHTFGEFAHFPTARAWLLHVVLAVTRNRAAITLEYGSPMTLIAETLGGHYRLVRLIGRGGMSDVYEALDVRTGSRSPSRSYAAGDPEFVRRLSHEARALESFAHPGLVRLFDTGLAGDQAYLVMEYVDGVTLAEVLRRGPSSAAETAALGATLADALAYVHSAASCTAT